MSSFQLSSLISICALVLGGCSSGVVPAQKQTDEVSVSFSELMAETVYAQKSAGLSFAIYRDGEIIETGAFGVADLETGRAMTVETPTRLASLTKPVASALVLRAVVMGKINLDDPVWDYAARFKKQCPAAKSYFTENGLPFLKAVMCTDPSVTIGSMLSHTSSAPAGSMFAYDGFLYGRLREVIERAYDQTPMETLVQAEVIMPLSLEDSAAGIEDEVGVDVLTRLARPHGLDDADTLVARDFLDDEMNAGAGMIASAPDAAKIFIDITEDERIASLLQETVTLSDGSISPYGYGVFLEQVNERHLLWHTGWQPGAYNGIWIHDLMSQSGLVLLLNTDLQELTGDFSGDSLTENAVAALFLSWLDNH